MKTSVRPVIMIAIICVKTLKAPSNVSVQKDLKWKVKTVLVSDCFGYLLFVNYKAHFVPKPLFLLQFQTSKMKSFAKIVITVKSH